MCGDIIRVQCTRRLSRWSSTVHCTNVPLWSDGLLYVECIQCTCHIIPGKYIYIKLALQFIYTNDSLLSEFSFFVTFEPSIRSAHLVFMWTWYHVYTCTRTRAIASYYMKLMKLMKYTSLGVWVSTFVAVMNEKESAYSVSLGSERIYTFRFGKSPVYIAGFHKRLLPIHTMYVCMYR